MINILIVDDDERKRKAITEVLKSASGDKVVVMESSSAAAAVVLLQKHDVSLLIVDMNLPVMDGKAPIEDGGIRFLRQVLKSGASLKRPHHIVGLTAYEELSSKYSHEFSFENWSLLQYEAASDIWKTKLTNMLIHVLAAGANSTSDSHQLDLAIITALKPVELAAILALPGSWKTEKLSGDDTIYHRGVFTRDGKSISVVAAASIEMGSVAAACLTLKLIQNYRPRCIAMSGIAGGLVGHYGDILVADQSWDYCAGKIVDESDCNKNGGKNSFKPAPSYVSIDSSLKEKLQSFGTQSMSKISSIRDGWQGTAYDHALQLHVGAIATGSAVIESKAVIDEIKDKNRKTVGLDMETFGVYMACKLSLMPKPIFFSAKSICDFAVPPKEDHHQKYAAYTSARFIYEFALDQLVAG